MAWYDAAVGRLLVPLSAATFACEAPVPEPRAPESADGISMWSAFVCATYAERLNRREDQERHIRQGYEAGVRFLEGWPDMTEEERQQLPVALLFRLGGPSHDFIIGRIYEAATEVAHDNIVRNDAAGLPIQDPNQWRRDEAALLRAEHLYRTENCELLR